MIVGANSKNPEISSVKCKGNVQIETVENELDVSLTKREHKREKSGS